MCGVTGFYYTNNIFSQEELIKMNSALVHRGPDAEGYFYDNFIGLGHRRLKIIDLSDEANQPMHSHCGRYVIVYNGEVYNFKEIAQQFGITPKTKTDTEIILEAFAKSRVNFIHQLNGMFAFAIYDKQKQKLFIFRDRIGIKPLFYFWDKKIFAFASELKALLQLSYIRQNRKINKQAISNYLYLGYIPEPQTIYENIYKLPAGHYLKFDGKRLDINYYWKADEQLKPNVITDFNQAKEQLKNLLIQSIKRQLISDVPLGVFLSGGIDSSTITAIAQNIGAKSINTFTIGFREEKFNEADYARKIAEYLGTNHNEFIVSYKEAIELIPEIIQTYDEPFADSSAIPTMLVAKLARQYVTMTLSGEGGDELFHGYGTYRWAKRLSNPFISCFRYPIAWTLSKLSLRYKRASYIFKYPYKDAIKSHIFSQEQYFFTQQEIRDLLSDEYNIKPAIDEVFNNLNRELLPAEEQSLYDLKFYLKDDLLVKTDRASMKYSLETRVPLLDHQIVEFALNLSPKLKTRGDVQKFLLKQVLYDYVPEKYFERPKWGFAIPLKIWLKTDLNYLIKEELSEKIIKKYNIVKYDVVKNLIYRFENGEDYLYNRLWELIILHKWLLV